MKRPESRPFLGTTTDKSAAFPDITSMVIDVEQDKYGNYSQHAWQRKSTYTKDSIPRYAQCLNPRCQQGGLDLQSFVMIHSDGTYTYPCGGHEGTPKGRRVGNPCMNSFTVTVKTKRKVKE